MKAKLFAALLGACVVLPAVSSATTYTYIPTSGDIVPSFFFTTTLSGAALDNLPAGTTILGTLTANTFDPIPTTDIGGSPIGFHNPTSGFVQIGTDGTGQITSWNINENFFAFYPGTPGGNPADVSCEYNASTTPGGNLLQLTNASDGFVCIPGAESAAGSFLRNADVAATPLPAALPLFASGLGALGLFGWKRKKKTAARAG
jgi:hypothetical protein